MTLRNLSFIVLKYMDSDLEFLDGTVRQSLRGVPQMMEPLASPNAMGAVIPSPMEPQMMPSIGFPPGQSFENLDGPIRMPPGYDPTGFLQDPNPLPLPGTTVLPPLKVDRYDEFHHPHRYMGLNCIDIAHHLKECPVCSQLHRSYSNYYVGVIIALLIVILFLGRKFFE